MGTGVAPERRIKAGVQFTRELDRIPPVVVFGSMQWVKSHLHQMPRRPQRVSRCRKHRTHPQAK